MIAAALYRRDHKSAGSSTFVQPQRHLPSRGQNSADPEKHRYHPALRAPPPGQHCAAARRPQPARGQPGLDTRAGPRTVITVVPPPAPVQPTFPGTKAKRNTGRAAAMTDMATVALSSNLRTTNPADHIKTTPLTTAHTYP
jgi:hypothetical protein